MTQLAEFSKNISIVIPAFNNQEAMVETLLSIVYNSTDGRPKSVRVVDNNSITPLSIPEDVAESFRDADINLSLAVERTPGPAAARNAGWKYERDNNNPEYILFMDSGCDFTASTLAGYKEALIPGALAYQGMIASKGSDWLSKYYKSSGTLLPPEVSGGFPRYTVTANLLVTTEALTKIGGFNESFSTAAGEDIDLGFRLIELADSPSALAYAEGSSVEHHWLEQEGEYPTAGDLQTYIKRQIRYGKGQYELCLLHPNNEWCINPPKPLNPEDHEIIDEYLYFNPNDVIETPFEDSNMRQLQEISFAMGYYQKEEEVNATQLSMPERCIAS